MRGAADLSALSGAADLEAYIPRRWSSGGAALPPSATGGSRSIRGAADLEA